MNIKKSLTSIDEWKIVENEFHPIENEIVESLCSIGNAQLGQRANFEEHYSGKTFQGSYIAGIYYPDKTKVGWWKNGYPEYFAKVLNSVNWIGLDFTINDIRLDLNNCNILSFYRELNMKSGTLNRTCSLELSDGTQIEITTTRFYSIKRKEVACLKYSIKLLKGQASINCSSYFDLNVHNLDTNYDEAFWTNFKTSRYEQTVVGSASTKKTDFKICLSQQNVLELNDQNVSWQTFDLTDHSIHQSTTAKLKEGDTLSITKYSSITTSRYHKESGLVDAALQSSKTAFELGFSNLLEEHQKVWSEIWNRADIQIPDDQSAQQAIRFNIFHLNQTYDGSDERLNIGPKGFTGEKYGGSTYWDTEAYCLPFYLFTAPQKVSENLLKYRFDHLSKAIENAKLLGFNSGAALYPMVTMNGEECHNEWEITFEEIHRNGAIAYAIYDYAKHFNDASYLKKFGIEVLIGISRFWAQRAQYSVNKAKYVILGVTGPNEYENNVNNNWYTNYIAKWCINYTLESIKKHQEEADFKLTLERLNINEEELETWQNIANGMYFPFDDTRNIYLQQDGFLDKDLTPVQFLLPENLPINQKWSWDRILRSAYIKQADVLQGFYFFEDDFTDEELARHFDFYEPLTVHESSLSPCVHAIQAAKLKRKEKAYEMYLRTARLDLDNYNNDTEDGLHITSMAGTWMAIVKGFAGARVKEGIFSFDPCLPDNWHHLSFKTMMSDDLVSINISDVSISFEYSGSSNKTVFVNHTKHKIQANRLNTISY